MLNITLKEFKEKFYPGLSGVEFSKAIGFNNSFINKVLNDEYVIKKPAQAETYNALKDFVYAKSGKELILGSAIAKTISYSNKKSRDLNLEISFLKEENYEWQEVCTILAISLAARRTSENKNVYKRGKLDYKAFMKEFKKNFKEIGE